MRIARARGRCVLPPSSRTFEAAIGAAEPKPAKRRPFIDTSSSALVTDFVFAGH